MNRRDAATPPALRQRRPRPTRSLPVPAACGGLLVRLEARHTALFRFLLEAYGHVATFSVLEPKTALLHVIFSPHTERQARRALEEIGQSLPLELRERPCSRAASVREQEKAGGGEIIRSRAHGSATPP